MMKHNLGAILLICAVLVSAAATAQTTQKLSAGKASDYGLVYSLPITAVDIYLEAELTEEHPGEFYNYAKRHLNISNGITADGRSARLISAVIVPRGLVDSNQQWLVQFKAGTPVTMTLTPEGIPLAINTDVDAEVTEVTIPQARAAEPSPLEGDAARQAITQDMARSSSLSKKAELAAQQIFNLREMRSDILSGQAENPPADGKAMQLVLDNLAAQEAALTAMFAGVRSNHTVVEKVTFVPDSNEVKGKVLARLSAVDGIVDADNLAGAPITIDMRIIEQGTLPLTDKGEVKTFPKGGVAYRIPGKAELTINYGGRRIASAEVSLAQLGTVFGINPALFTDKKQPYFLIFDSATGAAVELGTK